MNIKGQFIPDELAEKLMEGDERCEFPIGQRIVKNNSQPGDIHKVGCAGVIIGSIQVEHPDTSIPVDTYLIQFDKDPEFTIALMVNIDDRIVKEDEFQSPS